MSNFHVSLQGKTILVTGASKGLGAFFANRLATAGASVAVAARRLEDCERVCAHIRANGGTAIPIALDVASSTPVAAAIDKATHDLGGLDIVVNNAGVTETVPLIDQDEASWDRIIDTNLKGAFLVGQAAARIMSSRKTGGAIINVASILGHRVAGQVAAYAASKAALVQLTKSMALEWARHNIRVNALCPDISPPISTANSSTARRVRRWSSACRNAASARSPISKGRCCFWPPMPPST
jgi:NAD(P)-dependent dehydrogenase (short-subunit alcohol dehydrogenase family)